MNKVEATKQRTKIVLVVAAGLIVAIGLSLLFIMYQNNKRQAAVRILDFIYGDSLTGFELYDSKGEAVTQLPQEGTSQFVIYLSADCGSCVQLLRGFSAFREVFLASDMPYSFVWFNKIPKDQLAKYDIPLEHNYSLQGKSKLSFIAPTLFILGAERKVEFTSNELNTVMDKIIADKTIAASVLQARANARLVGKIKPYQADKETLLLFSMQGCPDCEFADAVIEQHKLEEKYNLLRIYRAGGTEQAEEVDQLAVYQKAYGLDWYPTFVRIKVDGSYSIVREIERAQLAQALTAD